MSVKETQAFEQQQNSLWVNGDEQRDAQMYQNNQGTKGMIEKENEMMVAEILEKRAQQQLKQLCGEWSVGVSGYNIEIIPDPLLKWWKSLCVLFILDIGWVSGCSFAMPTAGMHIVENYITTNFRGQMAIYWSTQIPFWLCVASTLTVPTTLRCKLSLATGLMTFIWHLLHFIAYQLFSSDRQQLFPFTNALFYWLETAVSIPIIAVTLQLFLKLQDIQQTHPNDLPMPLLDASLLEQNNNNPNFAQNPNDQQTMLQKQQSFKAISQSQYLKQSQRMQPYQVSEKQQDLAEMVSRIGGQQLDMEQSRFVQEKNVVIDDIEDENTAIVSVFKRNWRTHYGEYAPDIKKRRILTPDVVRALEEDLKASRKIKLQSNNAVQYYSYFDLHFVDQQKNQPFRVQMRQSPIPTMNNTNVSMFRPSKLPSARTINPTEILPQSKQDQQFSNSLQYQQSSQAPKKSSLQDNSIQSSRMQPIAQTQQQQLQNTRMVTQQSQQPQSQQQQQQTKLSFYGETAMGFNQKTQELNKANISEQNQFSSQQQQQQLLRGTSQTFARNFDPVYHPHQEKESEYFKAKATVAEVLDDKKKRWGNAKPIQKTKTFNFDDDIDEQDL